MPSNDNRRPDLIELYYGLDNRVAVMNEQLSTLTKLQGELAQSMKNMSVVSQHEYQQHLQAEEELHGKLWREIRKINEKLGNVERSTSFWVKLKNRVGDRGFDILVTIIVVAIIYFLVMLIQGGSGGIENIAK